MFVALMSKSTYIAKKYTIKSKLVLCTTEENKMAAVVFQSQRKNFTKSHTISPRSGLI